MTLQQVTLLGRVAFFKADEFSEKFQMVGWGGGSFSIQKSMLQILDLSKEHFKHELKNIVT